MTGRDDIDLRPFVGPDVLDQGSRPTCATFAISACHEAVTAHRDDAEPDHYAPEAIWWWSLPRGQAGPNGMYLDDVIEAVGQGGQPPLSTWPYNASLGHGTEDPPPAAEAARPWDTAAFDHLPLANDGVEDALEDCLAAGYPVLLGIQVTDEFTYPDAQGRVEVPSPWSRSQGGHAIACVGAATLPGHGRHVLIKNSWGDRWGAGGYAFLPMAYLARYCFDACAPVTNRDRPVQSE
jgi:hypothetical protein